MAIDLNRFIGTFFDEAQEHLESIEERAMSLGANRRDPEILNAIFRAAHSIKGGSGTFGFTQLSEATHEMETLFDGLRKGQGQADDATIRLLLDACDVFKAHLARLRHGDRGADPAMEALRVRVSGFRTSGVAAAPAAAAAPEAASPAAGFRSILARPAAGAKDAGARRALEEALAAFGDILAAPDARRNPSRGHEPLPRRASRGARIRPSARFLRAGGSPRARRGRPLRAVRGDRCGGGGQVGPFRRHAGSAGPDPHRPGRAPARHGVARGGGRRRRRGRARRAANSPRSA